MYRIKTIFAVLIFAALILSNTMADSSLVSGSAFKRDVPGVFKDFDTGHWAFEEIRDLNAAGIALGYPDGTLRPDSHISRLEFIAILARITDYMEILYYPDVFKDAVKFGEFDFANSWAFQEWRRLSRRYEMARYPSVNTGSPGTYALEEAFGQSADLEGDITRSEAAVLLSPFLVKTALYLQATRKPFNDVGGCSQEEEIVRAFAYKIIKGYPDGSFRPGCPISRCEAFVMISRFMKKCDFTEASDSYRPHEKELRMIYGNSMLDKYLNAAKGAAGFEPVYPTDDFSDLRSLMQNVFMLEKAGLLDRSAGYYTLPDYVEYFDDFPEFYKRTPANRLYDPSKSYLKTAYKIFSEIIDINSEKKLVHLLIISKNEEGVPTAYSAFRYLVLYKNRWLIDFNGTDMGSGKADDPCEIIKGIPGFANFDCGRYGVRIEF